MSENSDLPQCDTYNLEHTTMMTEIGRVVRYSTAALGGYLVAHGYMSAASVELVTGIIVTATPIVAGMILARVQRRHISTAIQSLKAGNPPSPSDGPPKGE